MRTDRSDAHRGSGMSGGTLGIVAAVAIGIVLMSTALWLSQRGRRPPDTHAVAVPGLTVVTLGMRGSGKTLLLAGMYRCMRTPSDREFYLRAPHDQAIELSRWFQDVEGPDDIWPARTRKPGTREFVFDLLTPDGGGREPVLRIRYLECAGELLTEPHGSTARAELLSAVHDADALIGIVDGLRVLQAFHGDHRGAADLRRSVDAMASAMSTARSPVTFVVTKWDLLDDLHPDANVRLGIVRTLLMELAGFRDLVREHGRRRVIRLIPVTALGHDFAVLDDGIVHTKPGGPPAPENVELPLSTVVPDVLVQAELALDAATRRTIVAQARSQTVLRPRDAMNALGAVLARLAGRSLATGGIDLLVGSWLAPFLDTHGDGGPLPGSDHQAALTEADRRAQRAILARRQVIRNLQHQTSVLEMGLPASRLDLT